MLMTRTRISKQTIHLDQSICQMTLKISSAQLTEKSLSNFRNLSKNSMKITLKAKLNNKIIKMSKKKLLKK